MSYSRRARKGESGLQWSVGSRIVGFEVDEAKNNIDCPSVCWVICDGLPVCVSTSKLRPCSAAELLAYQYMSAQKHYETPVAETSRQQNFVDERDDRAHSEPERDDRAHSEPEAMPIDEETNSDAEASLDEDETLKNIFDEYTKDEAKELRADALTTSPVPFAPSSSSVKRKELRAEPPATKPEERHSLNQAFKRSKTTGKGADMVENIAMLLVGESVERTSFLQVRLVGPRPKKITKKTVRPKDGDKNLRYADCSPDIQAGLRKCRAEEWQKWQKYNAGVIISGDELSTLQAEGIQVYPMQWIETDKNAHKRRSN